MSGHTPWAEIRHKSPPERRAATASERERDYARLRWRFVRLVDRVRGRARRG